MKTIHKVVEEPGDLVAIFSPENEAFDGCYCAHAPLAGIAAQLIAEGIAVTIDLEKSTLSFTVWPFKVSLSFSGNESKAYFTFTQATSSFRIFPRNRDDEGFEKILGGLLAFKKICREWEG